jgi:hypothetical protein
VKKKKKKKKKAEKALRKNIKAFSGRYQKKTHVALSSSETVIDTCGQDEQIILQAV